MPRRYFTGLYARRQQHVASTLHVFLQISPNDERNYAQSCTMQLPYPTDDSRLIISAAQRGIRHLFQPGYRFLKAGVGLIDILDKTYTQADLFTPAQSPRADALMNIMDGINRKYGRGTVHTAAEGVQKKWAMRQGYRSPGYTTRWEELPRIKC